MNDHWGQRPEHEPPSGWIWWLALMLGVAALVGFLAWQYPDAIEDRDDWGWLTYLVILLALVTISSRVGSQLRRKQFAKYATLWIGVFLVLLVGYTYRLELGDIGNRVIGEVLPYRATNLSTGEVRLRADIDGHYRVEALVDGKPVRFLIDTGASGVVLSPGDAIRLGYDPRRLRYTRTAETANGTVRSAPIRLEFISVGQIQMLDFPASVNEVDMSDSLLGMSFLARLRSFEVRDGMFIMRQ